MSGITAGVQGKRAYLSSYPVSINCKNAGNGVLEIYSSGKELVQSYQMDDSQYYFESSILLDKLREGEYRAKVKLEDEYVTFLSGCDHEKFEVVPGGTGDRRVNAAIPGKDHIEFSKVSTTYSPKDLDPDFVLLFGSYSQYFSSYYLSHKLFDFCFRKRADSNWEISLDRSKVFAAVLDPEKMKNHPAALKGTGYDSGPVEYRYMDNNFNTYDFEARARASFNIPIRINREMYIAGQYRPDHNIILNCFEFELTGLDAKLGLKFEGVAPGCRVYLLTNYNDVNRPENLLTKVIQEFFPFKSPGNGNN
jgi:hypothetical protein